MEKEITPRAESMN